MCRFWIVTHHQTDIIHHQDHIQWYSMKQRNGKPTANSTPDNAMICCIISSMGPVTTIYARVGNLWTTVIMPEIWLTNLTQCTLIDRENRGMQFESGGMVDREAVWTFHMYSGFSSVLFISSLDVGLVRMLSVRVSTTSQRRWSFRMRQICRKVVIELYRSAVGLVGSYDCVRRMIVSFLVPFLLLLLYWLWQTRKSAHKEGDNVTVTRDPRLGER